MLINAVVWASEQASGDENLLDRLLALIASKLGSSVSPGISN